MKFDVYFPDNSRVGRFEAKTAYGALNMAAREDGYMSFRDREDSEGEHLSVAPAPAWEDMELRDLDKVADAPSIEIPPWVEQDITVGTVEAICQGGCASGAYIPAVTYCSARETMNEHGDDVLEYVDDNGGEMIPGKDDYRSWHALAVFYLSQAVELWAYGLEDELEDARVAWEGDDETEED